jgi:hypothetical protein
MRIHVVVAAAGALLAAAAGCGGSPHAAEAEKVVAQFVHADTLGSWEEAMSLVAACTGPAMTPALHITSGVTVDDARPGAGKDSVLVTAYYRVVGTAEAGEPGINAVPIWHFTPANDVDTVIFRLGADSAGSMYIACGPLPIHRVPSQMPDQLTQMDPASRSAFEAATARH